MPTHYDTGSDTPSGTAGFVGVFTASPVRSSAPPPAIRMRVQLRVLDRIALHAGVALIAWSRRSRALESRERRANRAEQQLAIRERERAADRMLRLAVPPR